MKPKLISDSEVRITDISVRSALMRVRWNDMPVRRDDSSTEIRSGSDDAGDGVIGRGHALSPHEAADFRANHQRAMRAIGPRSRR